jgi:glycosyltransferase involved in cell wall biosynthesis
MNILFLNSMKSDEFGGGEKWMIAAATGLQQRGHLVILAGKAHSLFVKKALEATISTACFNIKGDFSPLTTWKIRRFLKQNKIEVLICNFNKDLRVGGLAARLAGTPFVLARHGLVLCEQKWRYKISLTFLADGILTNSQAIKNTYLSYGWFDQSFIKVIYNGVAIKPEPVSEDLKMHWPGKKIILAAGRLTVQKGFSYLIEAAALLKEKRDDFHVIIAGGGSLYPLLEQQICDKKLSDCVTLKGHVDDMTPYLQSCDMVVLSSLYEGMPNIILEAMAVGKAVVATNVHGVRELVLHEKTGIMVPPKDTAALMQAIHDLLDNSLKRTTYGKQGLQRVKENFSMEKMIDNIEDYLTEQLNR